MAAKYYTIHTLPNHQWCPFCLVIPLHPPAAWYLWYESQNGTPFWSFARGEACLYSYCKHFASKFPFNIYCCINLAFCDLHMVSLYPGNLPSYTLNFTCVMGCLIGSSCYIACMHQIIFATGFPLGCMPHWTHSATRGGSSAIDHNNVRMKPMDRYLQPKVMTGQTCICSRW